MSMANFEPIVQWLLYQEDDHKTPGKIVNLGDGAGSTRLGITSVNFSAFVPAEFFTTMLFKEAVAWAKRTYRSEYWNRLSGDLFVSDELAAMLLSFSVNKNRPVAIKALQRALGVTDDGVLGPVTLHEVNQKDVVPQFRAEWINYYHHLVDINPSNQRWINGWINRANFSYPSSLVPGIYA